MPILPRNKLGLLLIASVLLFSLPAFIYVATIKQDFRILALRKDLVCDSLSAIHTSEKADKAKIIQELTKNQQSLPATLQEYKKSGGSDTEVKNRLRQSANVRKKILKRLIQEDPAAALSLLERNKSLEKSLTDATSNCTATPTSIEGTLTVGHADFVDDTQKSKYFYSLTTNDKKNVQIHTNGTPKKALSSGAKAKVTGYMLDQDMVVDTRKADSIASQARSVNVDHAQGEQKTAVILVDTTVTKKEMHDHVFTTINNYYKEVSYGKVSLTGETYGPYSVADTGCDSNGIPLNTQNVLDTADNDIDFTGVKRVIIIGKFCVDKEGTFPWHGYGMSDLVNTYSTNEGNGPFSIAWAQNDHAKTGILAHELGHNFGIDHAFAFDCGEPGICTTTVDYGNPYSAMGVYSSMGQLGAPHRDLIGWFDEGNIQTVSESGSYIIEPIEEKSTGLKALKIPRGGDPRSGSEFLYIEYRQPIGFDEKLSAIAGSNVFKGALLQVVTDNPQKPILLDPLEPIEPFVQDGVKKTGGMLTAALLPQESFTDPATGTVITVTEATTSALTVTIDYKGEKATITPDPTTTGSPSTTPDPCELSPTPDETDDGSISPPPTENQDPQQDPGQEENPTDTRNPDQKSLRDRIREQFNKIRRSVLRQVPPRPMITVVVPTPDIRRPEIPEPRKPFFKFPDFPKWPFSRNNNREMQENLSEEIRSQIPTPRTPSRIQITVAPRKPNLPNTKKIVEQRLQEAGVQGRGGKALENPCDPTPSPNTATTPTPAPQKDIPTPTQIQQPSPTEALARKLTITVKDGDNRVVSGASVTVNNGRDGGCTTSSTGRCVFTVYRTDSYAIYASKVGYSPGKKTVSVRKDVAAGITILKKPTVSPTKSNLPIKRSGVPQSASILLYNDILDCYSETASPRSCDDVKKQLADLNSDSKVDQRDYILFITQIR